MPPMLANVLWRCFIAVFFWAWLLYRYVNSIGWMVYFTYWSFTLIAVDDEEILNWYFVVPHPEQNYGNRTVDYRVALKAN